MHIEIGIIDAARLTAANAAAAALVAGQIPALIRSPGLLPRVAAVGVGVAALMQSWHLSVGPSELHLIGATTAYLFAGLPATLVGFALALALQCAIEPQDLAHLGVNILSLGLPLLALHHSFGRRLFDAALGERFSYARVIRLDVTYYAGVAAMVAFWLGVSNDPMPVRDWAVWALAYLPVFLAEATLSFAVVMLVRRSQKLSEFARRHTEFGRLRFAG
jgi:ABC-type Co2+ transport system permease subunit